MAGKMPTQLYNLDKELRAKGDNAFSRDSQRAANLKLPRYCQPCPMVKNRDFAIPRTADQPSEIRQISGKYSVDRYYAITAFDQPLHGATTTQRPKLTKRTLFTNAHDMKPRLTGLHLDFEKLRNTVLNWLF